MGTQSNNTDHKAHRDAWELLPWYVTGRLPEADRTSVDAHLRDCDECQQELRDQRQLQERLAEAVNTSSEAMDVDTRWAEFREGLDAQSGISATRLFFGSHTKAWLIPAAVAALVVLAVPVVMNTGIGLQDFGRTTAHADAQASSDLLRIVFASGASSRSIDSLLDANHLRQLPGQEGALVRTVQILPVSDQAPIRDTETVMEQLNESSVVVFVECVE